MTISIEKRELMVSLYKKEKSAKEIADTLEVPFSTVNRILLQYKKTGDITSKVSTGRHRLLSPRDERELLLTMRRDPRTRPSTLCHSLPTKVSVQTVRRTLVRTGLHAYRMRRKPSLTAAQREARLKWAREYAKKPADFWDSVIFSDESSWRPSKGDLCGGSPMRNCSPHWLSQRPSLGGTNSKSGGASPAREWDGSAACQRVSTRKPTSLSYRTNSNCEHGQFNSIVRTLLLSL